MRSRFPIDYHNSSYEQLKDCLIRCPDEECDPVFSLKLLKLFPKLALNMPVGIFNEEMISFMFSEEVPHYIFNFIPKSILTMEHCLKAVSINGHNIQYVPSQFITNEMCEIAVRKNYFALGHLDEKMQTPEMCLLALDISEIEDGSRAYVYSYVKICDNTNHEITKRNITEMIRLDQNKNNLKNKLEKLE